MEIYQLKTFATVAELGHLTRAADKLHVSQPAVSGQIRALEEALEVSLFERGPAGMTLTVAGRKLLPYAEEVIRAAKQMRSAAESIRGRLQGSIRVGTVSDPGYLRIGVFLAKVVEQYPLIDVELHQESSGEIIEQLRAGKLDVGFYFGASLQVPVEGLKLRDMTYRIIAPHDWTERIAAADWVALAAMPWVMSPPNSSHRRMIADAFASHGLEPRRAVEADQESVIADLVASGVGLSIAREEAALAGVEAGRWVIWEPARISTTLWFVYPTREAASPVIKALIEVLRDVWELPAPKAEPPASQALSGRIHAAMHE